MCAVAAPFEIDEVLQLEIEIVWPDGFAVRETLIVVRRADRCEHERLCHFIIIVVSVGAESYEDFECVRVDGSLHGRLRVVTVYPQLHTLVITHIERGGFVYGTRRAGL